MKTIILLLVSALFASAQPKMTFSAPAIAKPGDTITVNVGVDAVGGTDLVALQWTLPAGAVVTGAQPAVQDKATVCSLLICMLFGAAPAPIGNIFQPGTLFNAFPMVFGPIQSFQFTIPATAAAGSHITLTPASVLGVTSRGASLSFTIVPADIVVRDSLDLSGDGTVDATDAQQALNQWLNSKSAADFTTLVMICARLQH